MPLDTVLSDELKCPLTCNDGKSSQTISSDVETFASSAASNMWWLVDDKCEVQRQREGID